MRLTQDDCPSISVSRLRALGEVTEEMANVRVTIAGASREVRLSHIHFPNGGGWSFFVCPSCGRQARVLRLYDKIACWRCTGLPYRVWQRDLGGRIERLRARLDGAPARLKPRPGRTIDRRWRTEQALQRALNAERRRVKGARDALSKARPDGPGKLR